jgi:hypothetical protein
MPTWVLSSQWLKSALNKHGPTQELRKFPMPAMLTPFDDRSSIICQPIRHFRLSFAFPRGFYRANGSNLPSMSMG